MNGTSSKFIGIIVYSGILLAINLLIQPIMRMDPKYANMGGEDKAVCTVDHPGGLRRVFGDDAISCAWHLYSGTGDYPYVMRLDFYCGR